MAGCVHSGINAPEKAHAGVVQEQVFEMDELAVDPQRGGRIRNRRRSDPALCDRRFGDVLVLVEPQRPSSMISESW